MLKAGVADCLPALEQTASAEHHRCGADGGNIRAVLRGSAQQSVAELRFIQIGRAGHTTGQNQHLNIGKRIFRRQIGGHGDAVRTGHDPFFGHADRFCINAGAAQKIQRAKRLNLFKAVRKQNIDHENHPFGNVIVVLFPCAMGV